jgi:ankyrin repeat protein
MRKRDLVLPERFRRVSNPPEEAVLDVKAGAELIRCIRNDDISSITHILDAGADPDVGIEGIWAVIPLSHAVLFNNMEAIELLLKAGANPERSRSIFRSAKFNLHSMRHPFRMLNFRGVSEWTRVQVATLLFSYGVGSDRGWDVMDTLYPPAIQGALENGCLDYAQLLINNGSDLTEITLENLDSAKLDESRMVGLVEFLSENGALHKYKHPFPVSVLGAAIVAENYHLIKDLLAQAFPVNRADEQGITALHLATACQSDEILAVLLKHGANVEARDAFGVPPLLEAVAHGHEACVQHLLSSGANVNATRDVGKSLIAQLPGASPKFSPCIKPQWSALQIASYCGFTSIISLLLSFGANRSYQGPDGETALDLAIEKRNYNAASCLLKYGAPFALDSSAVSLFYIHAFGERTTDLVAMLIESGAQPAWAISENTTKEMGLGKEQQLSKLKNTIRLLDEAMERLKPYVEPGHNEIHSNRQLCTRCTAFFCRSYIHAAEPFSPSLPFGDSCKLCGLLQDSYPQNELEGKLTLQLVEKNNLRALQGSITPLAENVPHMLFNHGRVRQLPGRYGHYY